MLEGVKADLLKPLIAHSNAKSHAEKKGEDEREKEGKNKEKNGGEEERERGEE